MQAKQYIEDLISRTALGDRKAFRDLYAHTSAKLYAVCLRVLRNRAEADDALQEIYVKIWRNAATFGPSDYSPNTWLIAIARHHAIDLIRARKPQAEDIDEQYDLRSGDPDPENSAIATDQRRQIDGCLDQLDAPKASAVRGAYLDGLSYEELSQKYNVPLNTMRTWLRRSLANLRECLEQ
jgi:RNA polymerase sigma-70 factor (ECF subfamily)